MAFVQTVMQSYHFLFEDFSDRRTRNWWLVSGPGPLLTVLSLYLYFSIKAGPKYMRKRKPYNLKLIVIIYNIFQINLSAYITYLGIRFIATETYRDGCYLIDYSENPTALKWASGVWWFYFSKFTELSDTVFIVLRKKERQISFLHIYHHTIMPIIGFLGTKYAAGGQSAPQGTVNSFVHVLMYTYYLVSGLGRKYQKYLWWKKYLTSMQLIQFCIVIFLNINSLCSSTCNYPKFLSILVVWNCIVFFFMFSLFYYDNYIKEKNKYLNIRIRMSTKSKL